MLFQQCSGIDAKRNEGDPEQDSANNISFLLFRDDLLSPGIVKRQNNWCNIGIFNVFAPYPDKGTNKRSHTRENEQVFGDRWDGKAAHNNGGYSVAQIISKCH